MTDIIYFVIWKDLYSIYIFFFYVYKNNLINTICYIVKIINVNCKHNIKWNHR